MSLYRRTLLPYTPAVTKDTGSLLQGTDSYDGRRWSTTSGTLTAMLPLARKCRGMKSAFVGGGAVQLQPSGTDIIWRHGIEHSSLLFDAVGNVEVSCDGFRWEVKNGEIADNLLSWTTKDTNTGNENHYVISATKAALSSLSLPELVTYVNDKNTNVELSYLDSGVLQVLHTENVDELILTAHGVLVKQVNNSDADLSTSILTGSNTTGVIMNIIPQMSDA